MLKNLLIWSIALLTSLSLNAQSITVTSPNGAEALYTGKTHAIKWTSSSISSGLVKIEYSASNGSTWELIHSGTNNSGTYNWVIPKTAVGNDWLIRISDATNAAVNDVSNAVFSVQHPFVKLISPNGGEALTGCTTHKVMWDRGGISSYVRLYYAVNGSNDWIYIDDVYTASSKEYNWSVPTLGSATVRFKIADSDDATILDVSDDVFSASKLASSLSITSPNGGESWSASSGKKVTWTSAGTVGNVTLQYSINAGSSWTTASNRSNASNIANSGSFNWVLPENTTSSTALVRIYEHSKTCNIDYSNSFFAIDNNPAVAVTFPNQGEKLYAGRPHTIYWSASNLPTSNVKLEYSTDNGANWSVISNSTYNGGNYNWNVPQVSSTQCLLRVSAATNPAISDISDEPFRILPQTITVKTPNGGESLVGCSSYNITWDQEGVQDYVKLYYSVDEGINWIYIDDDYIVDNSNSYNWPVPSLVSDKVRVKVVGYYNAAVKDSSDAVSTVSAGANSLTLTSLNTGGTYASSSNQLISWTTTGTVGNVSLKYSVDGGLTWDWVKNSNGNNASNIPNTGSYTWLIPANTLTTKALVQVYENSKRCVTATSAQNFSINNDPVITLTAPVSSSKVYGARSYRIYWSASNLPGTNVKVEYTGNNGASWQSITNSVYNNGYIDWTVPTVYTSTYQIRVTSITNPSLIGLSQLFSVIPQTITLKTPNGGENLTGCSNYPITWDQEGVQDYVKLYYSVDEGINWIYIDDDYIVDNSNSYNWSVPSLSSDKLRVKAVGYYNAAVKDSSDAPAVLSPSANGITLTSLNTGGTFASSSNQIISWTNTGTVGNVSLKYSIDAGLTWEWVKNSNGNNASNIANTGSYTWLIPANTLSTKALVQVYEHSKRCVTATSAQNFTINNDPVITLTAPVSTSKVYGGRTYRIAWSASSLPGTNVRIEFTGDNGANWQPINNNVYNNGYIDWNVPRVYTGTYQIRVSSVTNPSLIGLSQVFSVIPQKITVKTPNGGESVSGCATYRITWDQEGVQDYVKLYYSTDGGNIWYFIDDDYIVDNTNYYDWTVPSLASSTLKIKVRGYYDAAVKDSSDQNFSVNQGASGLVLTSPNGGESWASSSVQRISWTTNGTVGNVSLKYSKDAGNTWEWVRNATGNNASNTANVGFYDWLLPENTVASNCLVQIYEHAKTCVVDQSDNYFSINNNPTLTITSPNGGNVFYFGENRSITWSGSNLPGTNVRLRYSIDNGQNWITIVNSIYNGGAYSWKVPTTTSTQALIKVLSVTDSTITDVSNAVFAIKTPLLTVVTPNTGNENWLVGENKNITWTSAGLAGNAFVKIDYSSDLGKTWNVIQASVANSGSYIWTVPNISTSSQSYVKVSSLLYPESKDSNDFAFTITKPIVGVTVPNDGQVWYVGESKSIQWAGMGTTENIKIEYSINNGVSYSLVVASTANTGQYFWAIPYSVTPSTKAFIRISDVSNPANVDSSDVPFTIAKPRITLTAPNAGESWYLGQTKKISWTNTGMSSAKVKIEYSPDNGNSWSFVTLVNNTGNYDWTIPSTINPSVHAYLKISDENDASIKDSNDVAFKTVKPSLTVVSPNGGEVVYHGQTKIITWTKDGAYSPNVSIAYSANNGLAWTVITPSVANNQSFSWTPGSSVLPGNQYVLRIRDAVDTTIVDYSNAVFSVSKPTITLTYPNGGQTLYPAEAKNILWSSAALASSRLVKIEWSSNNGTSWTVLTEGVGNNGSYAWIPANVPGHQNLIRVSDVLDPSITDVSNAAFSLGKPVVTVTSPNGNEKWYPGEARSIHWTSGGLPPAQSMRIEVSADSLSSWTTLSSTAPNSGSYSWSIPLSQATTGHYFVRVSPAADASIADTSNAFFRILKPSLTLTLPNGGETFYIGAVKNIYWSAQGLSTSRKIKLSLSADFGTTWSVLVAETGNNGSYAWTVPAETVPGNYLIKISDVLDATIEDVSNNTFTISKPTITVVTPNGGEKWYHGQVKSIKWTSNALASSGTVKIDYSLNNGSTWLVLASSTPNAGSYDWTIPASITSEQVLVRVSSLVETSVTDQSNAMSSIRTPRAGDVFETALPVVALPSLITDTTSLYADQFTGVSNQPAADVFYSFTVPAVSDSLSFAMSANFQAMIHILSAKDVVVASSQAGTGYTYRNKHLVPGNTYYLVIEGSGTSSGVFRLNITNHIASPDLYVHSVTTTQSNFAPKEVATVSWTVTNIGRANSAVQWTERVYLQSLSGQNRTLLKQYSFSNATLLAKDQFLSRTEQVTLPATLNIGEQGVFVVEVIPGAAVQEHPAVTANNTAVQQTPWTIKKTLSVELSKQELTEGTGDILAVSIYRSGSTTDAVSVNVTLDQPQRFTFPAAVTLEAGKSGATFNLTAPANSAIEGTIKDTVRVSAAGFATAKAGLSLLDKDKAILSITSLPASAMEGTTVNFTVTTTMVSTQALEVFLTSSHPLRFPVPASVIIPAGSLSAVITVVLDQDNIPEIDQPVKITVGAANHHSANATILVQDEDLPGIELIIHNPIVSESGGPFATQATLRRTAQSNNFAFRANLSANLSNTLILPASISLVAGEKEKTFTIGVIDNSMVDGTRTVNITAAVFVSSCSCNASGTSSASVSTALTVTDNDGPALTLAANPLTFPEAYTNAGSLRITRNTPTTEALTVQLTSSDVNEATVPATAIIPVGKAFVDVIVTTINDQVTDGNKQVYFHASSNGYATGSVWAIVSDQNLPDLHIPSVSFSSSSVQAMDLFTYRLSIQNSGFVTAPSGVIVRGYLSKDNAIDAKDSLISEDVLPAIPAGQTLQFQNAMEAPNMPGDFKLIYSVNPEHRLSELLLTNNVSVAQSFKILPDYTATAVIASDYFLKGDPIPVTGSAVRVNGAVAANKKVEVYIITNGLRRTVMATTNAAGQYSTEFVPLANEAGYYTAGASFPGLNATEQQDQFNILGIRINNGQVPRFKVVLNEPLTGTLSVTNLSTKALTQFSLLPGNLPDGAKLLFDTIPVLPGSATINLPYKIVGSTVSPGRDFEVAHLIARANEGQVQATDVFYFCQAPDGYLVCDVTKLDIAASSSKGERVVELKVVNKGFGTTGSVHINLPQLNWLSAVTPVTMPSLSTGDTAVIILKFKALAEVPFDYPIKGNFTVVPQNGNTLNIPFTFTKVAESDGAVTVSVTNQFTFYSEGAPKVANASVKIKNYFSGQLYAEGFTDATGVFTAHGIPEGKHRIIVEKEKHLTYNGTVTIEPNRNVETTVFLNYQAITFNWSVVPTAVQDQYDIELITQFETHVPMPVVVMTMPKVMPKLMGSEIFAFNITLTNHGLITANDVGINLAQDSEYEFVFNYQPANLLAQQSIQIPVIMRRRENAALSVSSGVSLEAISDMLGIDKKQLGGMGSGGQSCVSYGDTYYWYKCSIETGLWTRTGVMYSFEGRVCVNTGSEQVGIRIPELPMPGCAVCPYVPVIPGVQQPKTFKEERSDCIDCIWKIVETMGNCGLPKRNNLSCVATIMQAIQVCGSTSSARVVSPTEDKSQARQSQTESSVLGAVFTEILNNLQIAKDSYSAQDALETDYYGDIIGSDAFPYFDSLSKQYVSVLDSIPPAAQTSILVAMKGYEIQEYPIQLFFTRWNTSVYARSKGVLQPNTEYPSIINWTNAAEYISVMASKKNEAIEKGFSSIDDLYVKTLASLNEALDQRQKAVCASVKVKFSQQLTMTREAFEGTLEIFNGHPSDAMEQLSVNVQIKDADGVPSNGLFEIQTKSLVNLSDVTGTGAIASQQTGTVKFIFIPERGAAPKVPTNYKFGGSVRYWDPYAQAIVTLPLSDVELTVNPSPDLMLHYFMERNILSDDPFTKPEIEPSIPAELAVMVENQGYGPAVNMVISSAQPEVIENEKGLAINFNLIGSNFQGLPKTLGVTDINFGTIPALQTRIGQWYFTSSLLGKFVSYEASVVHANSFGNPDLSLVKGVKLHELTRSIRAYAPTEDAINDFLVNDIFDTKDVPDIIYFSQGNKTAKVTPASEGSFSAPVAAPTFINVLTVTPSQVGWNYIKLNDPGNNLYELVSVTRSDGQVIPLSNAWLTFVTLPVGSRPVYENKFHFVDEFAGLSPVTYTVTWKPKNMDVPKVLSIEATTEVVTALAVQQAKVVFSKNIDPSTFTYEDVSLTFQGGSNIITSEAEITQVDSVTFIIDLSSFTTGNGFYNLTVQAADIKDIYGISGSVGKNTTWTQFLTVPTVQAFQGVPAGAVAASYDKIQVLFNLPIDASSVSPARFIILKNGIQQGGLLTIDSVNANKKLYYLSGLGTILTTDGTYELVVDLPLVRTVDQVSGVAQQSVTLTVDRSGPHVISMTTSKEGGLDPQHVTYVKMLFDENTKGFNTASVQLMRNGEVLYLNIDQLSNTDLKHWSAGNFGMHTYPEGEYSFTVYPSGFTDAIGNAGTSSHSVSWTVNRSGSITVSDLVVTPDLGYSAADGITSTGSLNATFTLSAEASLVEVYQADAGGAQVLKTLTNVSAGSVSVPVNLLSSGHTAIKVIATGVLGGEGTAQKNLFIDQTPLRAQWLVSNNLRVTQQLQSASFSFTSKLLNEEGLLDVIQFKRNGVVLSTEGLTVQRLNDTLYKVSGLNTVQASAGNYSLTLDVQPLKKYSSGIGGQETAVVSWIVESGNRAPVAKAGIDRTVTATGVITLDGSSSFDPDNDALSYRWIAPQGVVLVDSLSSRPSFTVEALHSCRTLPFLLVVKDNELFSTSTVRVVVNIAGQNYYKDEDNDGYGDEQHVLSSCLFLSGYVARGGDCDDADPAIHPGAQEIVDGKDNDCDGLTDVFVSIEEEQQSLFGVFAYPVPTEDQYTVYVNTQSNKEVITLHVYDHLGALIETRADVKPGEKLMLGAQYTKGLYIIEVLQGNTRKTIKVTKI